jgi:hypothetical protein
MSNLSLTGGIRLPEASRGDRATQVGSTQHFTGCMVTGDGSGVRLGYESHGEGCGALLFTARQDTADIIEQVRFEWVDEFGEVHNHFIDLVVVRKDGTLIGFAVRPMAQVSAEYLLRLSRIKEQAIEQGFLDDFRLFIEDDVCPIELSNAKLFHSVRRPDCFGDHVAQDIARKMTGVVTVGQLVSETGLKGMGFRALVRLIRSGQLQMLGYEQITYETMVFKAKEV